MKVWIQSQFQLFAEALALLVKEVGFEASLEQDAKCEVAIWDLTTASAPYPTPTALPTLAFTIGNEVDLAALLKQHYRGYLQPSDDRLRLKQALEAVRRGEIWADRKMLTRALDSFKSPELTEREHATLRLLSKGLSNRSIAEQLGITEGTVKMHVSHLFDKLSVRSRAELIARFSE